MKGQKRIVREIINLIVKFLKPYGLKDEMLNIPSNVKRIGYKVGFIKLGITVISLIFAFMLKASNMMIELRMILLGIILFMLYRGQQVVKEATYLFQSSENKKLELIFNDEIIFRGSQIIGKTSDKVLKFDKANKLYKTMSNESVMNCIKNYLKNLWQQKIQHVFDCFEIVSVTAMIVVAVITNTSISQVIFIPLIIIFVFISFISSAYISISRKDYYKKHREYDNEQSLLVNDLLRVPMVVKGDLDMRINKFQQSMLDSNSNIKNFHKKLNLFRFFTTVLEALSQYGIIIFFLLGVEWNNINLATLMQIAAVLAIVETALGNIGKIADTLNNHTERLTVLEREQQDISLILQVYHNESNKASAPRKVENINIKPFSIQYMEESENDKPFTLKSETQINIENGQVVILYGPSGSGKSTFMKMLTERIRLEKSTQIPSTSRYLFYDEKLRFGSLSIYEELFCCSKNPDLAKMQDILENLHLWSEIKSNCFDVWKWMKEKQFGQSLSNGQKQRLILAKMLYWLDEDIDVVILDECTSGLDDKIENIDSADAERILEYIVRFCNKDKKRITIISTHQNIDGFKQNLASEYSFRNLQFLKGEESNLVREM